MGRHCFCVSVLVFLVTSFLRNLRSYMLKFYCLKKNLTSVTNSWLWRIFSLLWWIFTKKCWKIGWLLPITGLWALWRGSCFVSEFNSASVPKHYSGEGRKSGGPQSGVQALDRSGWFWDGAVAMACLGRGGLQPEAEWKDTERKTCREESQCWPGVSWRICQDFVSVLSTLESQRGLELKFESRHSPMR